MFGCSERFIWSDSALGGSLSRNGLVSELSMYSKLPRVDQKLKMRIRHDFVGIHGSMSGLAISDMPRIFKHCKILPISRDGGQSRWSWEERKLGAIDK